MKKTLVVLIMVLVAAGVFAGGGQDGGGKPIVYKISAGVPETHFEVKALREMEKYVEAETNGEIDIQIFPNNQIGVDTEVIELIQQGVVQMVPSGTTALSNFEKSFSILSSPYMFNSIEDIGVLLNGPWGDELLATLSNSGLKGLGFGVLGMTNISNNVRPLVNPEDIEGIKLRVVPNPLLLDFYKAIGANPVSMSFNELFSALQQGVVDAQLNPFTTIESSNLHEVQKYISKTTDFGSLVAFVVNEAEFAKLSASQQKAIQEGVDLAVAYMAESVVAEELAAEQAILADGTSQINEVSAATKQAWLKEGFPVIEKYGREANADLFDKLADELGM